MNYSILRTEILNSARANIYAEYVVTNDMPKQNAAQKDQSIADLINSDSTLFLELKTSPIKRGNFLKAPLNPITGSALFSSLKVAAQTYEPLQYIIAELEGDGLEVSLEEELDGFLNQLTLNTNLSEEAIANIKKVFYTKRIITAAEVSIALRGSAEFPLE